MSQTEAFVVVRIINIYGLFSTNTFASFFCFIFAWTEKGNSDGHLLEQVSLLVLKLWWEDLLYVSCGNQETEFKKKNMKMNLYTFLRWPPSWNIQGTLGVFPAAETTI